MSGFARQPNVWLSLQESRKDLSSPPRVSEYEGRISTLQPLVGSWASRIPYPNICSAVSPQSVRVCPQRWRPMSPQPMFGHDCWPRPRQWPAVRPDRRRADFAWFPICLDLSGFSRFFSPPSGALPIAPSIDCHSHWMPSNWSYSCRPAAHNLRNTPSRSQFWKYRWAVLPGTCGFGAFHWQPVRRIKKMAFSTSRGLDRGRPRPRFSFSAGNRGLNFSHNSSGISHSGLARHELDMVITSNRNWFSQYPYHCRRRSTVFLG